MTHLGFSSQIPASGTLWQQAFGFSADDAFTYLQRLQPAQGAALLAVLSSAHADDRQGVTLTAPFMPPSLEVARELATLVSLGLVSYDAPSSGYVLTRTGLAVVIALLLQLALSPVQGVVR